MADIFDNTILCTHCGKPMEKTIVNKQGFELRAVICRHCNQQVIHPADINSLENFKNLKSKTYSVKLRVVGNSHAISIPKEIVEFMRHQERIMDDMVRLCFRDMHSLSLQFGKQEIYEKDNERVNIHDMFTTESEIAASIAQENIKKKRYGAGGGQLPRF